jgi:hypothetical protein
MANFYMGFSEVLGFDGNSISSPIWYNEVGGFIILTIIGFVILALISKVPSLVKRDELRKDLLEKEEYRKSVYDNIPLSELNSVVKNMNVGYPAVLTVYGILLAFIVSDKIFLATSSWFFIVWSGWILAILVRTGLVIRKFFDVTETKNQTEIIRIVVDGKLFFKHAFYFLIPTIAFLPTFFFTSVPSLEQIQDLPWGEEITILSVVFSFIIMFIPFYALPLRSKRLATISGVTEWYFVVIILIGLGAFAQYVSSPLEPLAVTIFGVGSYLIPTAIYTMGLFGAFFGFAMILYLIRLCIFSKNKD